MALWRYCMWPSDLMTLFDIHDRNKCPLLGSRDCFPLGFITGSRAGIVLGRQSCLQCAPVIRSGVGSFRPPNFPSCHSWASNP